MATLEIKNLHVSIEDKEILKGVNLTINTGEIHAVMGPNGTGKSTLSAAIMGHPSYEVTEGEILLDGENLSIINFGKLEVVERAPRLGRNPKTGEEVKIGKRKSVKFRPGKAFLEKLN